MSKDNTPLEDTATLLPDEPSTQEGTLEPSEIGQTEQVDQSPGDLKEEKPIEVKTAGKKKARKPAAPKSTAKSKPEVIPAATKEPIRKVATVSLEKIGKELLISNPKLKEIFLTADGRGFPYRNDAQNHAGTLKDKTVTTVARQANADTED